MLLSFVAVVVLAIIESKLESVVEFVECESVVVITTEKTSSRPRRSSRCSCQGKQNYVCDCLLPSTQSLSLSTARLSLYKILFPFKATCGSPSSLYPPTPLAKSTLIAILLHDHWATRPLTADPFVCCEPYNIGDGNIVSRPTRGALVMLPKSVSLLLFTTTK